ncbi:hypothetical protein PV10_09005 [Exophiala mesophila]|uniref:Uncharacterized protein n=1 Tax=Exophiala mesophila TaxID=212818 RepID=A0A0D1WH09_EXOME|nr:uncharacterized protein PV10_09005 [Exophiala mesophila]KIV88075.1 hypothetical protein PV10_09005 [Exophiala mesophila]
MNPFSFISTLVVLLLSMTIPTKGLGLRSPAMEPFIFKLKPSIKNPDCIGAETTKLSIKSYPKNRVVWHAACRIISDLISNNGGSPKVDVIFICGNGPRDDGTQDFKLAISYAKGFQVTGYDQVLNMTVSGTQEIPAHLTITQGPQSIPAVRHVKILIGAKVNAKKKTAKYEYISCV